MLEPGKVQTITSRDLESFSRCPMRYSIGKANKSFPDPKIEMFKALDATFNYTLVKTSIGINPSKNEMERYFNERMNHPEEVIREEYLQKGLKTLYAFADNFEAFKQKFEFVHPPFELEYSNYGITLKLLVNAIIKTKQSKMPVTRYVFFEYNNLISKPWNTFSRLWTSLAKEILSIQGITTIEMCALHVQSGKLMIPKQNSTNSVIKTVDSLLRSYATDSNTPVFTEGCIRCLVQADCSIEITS